MMVSINKIYIYSLLIDRVIVLILQNKCSTLEIWTNKKNNFVILFSSSSAVVGEIQYIYKYTYKISCELFPMMTLSRESLIKS